FQAEDGIRDFHVTGVQTCALPICFLVLSFSATAQSNLLDQVDQKAAAIEPKVIEWRRDFHQHPELGNEERRTAGIVAKHLRALRSEERRVGKEGSSRCALGEQKAE